MANPGKSGGKPRARRATRTRATRSKPRAAARSKPKARAPENPRDLDALLRYAAANPGARKRLLPAAEAAYLRLARDLKKTASTLPPAAREALEQRANAQYFRAVVAKNLAALLRARRPVRPRPAPLPQAPPPLLPSTVPGQPQNVRAIAATASATVAWDPRPSSEMVLSYTVTPFIGSTAQTPRNVGTLTQAVFPALTAGTTYTFKTHAGNLLGDGPDGISNPVTPTALTGTGPFTPTLPALSADPVLLLDPLAAPALPLVESAARTADKWRYEYLKELAIRSAISALDLERHISTLMEMAIAKVAAAEQLVNPTLIEAFRDVQGISSTAATLGSSHQLDDLLGPLSDLASQSLLLPRLLEFLATTSPLDFWVGLFEAMISDLAAAFFTSTSFSRTKRFLNDAFAGDLDGLRSGVAAAANDALRDLDAQVDAMTAPLRAAISQVVSGTREAMAAVFESFDLPVLMNPPATAELPDVPDVDPFLDVQNSLDSEIALLADQIKGAIRDKLSGLAGGGDSGLFVAIAVTYLALPILALLVISLAGGPFSAALLAAAVLLAAEELIHLLLRWLTGPLLKTVDGVKQRLAALVQQLQQLFALQSNLILNQNPAPLLDLLANELRVLRDLAPQAYLDDAAALLREARDVVLRTARDLAGAAEQAAGRELATAFETVQETYDSHLPAAPLLPGGSDAGRFAAAALIRDLGRLEQQRTFVEDGKDIEVTHRLSLSRLLGTGATGSFGAFLARREAVLHLDETQLADRMFPGMYRLLLEEVRVSGLFGGPPNLSAATSIPLTVTHLGPSSTRVKRGANPAAPPTELPDCLRLPQETADDDPAPAFKSLVLLPAVSAAIAQGVDRIFVAVPLLTYAEYFGIGLATGFGVSPPYGFLYRDKLLQALPDALATEVDAVFFNQTATTGAPLRNCAGFVDLDRVRIATRAALGRVDWDAILGILETGIVLANFPQVVPVANRDAARDFVVNALETGGLAAPSLPGAIGQAFDDAVAAFRKRIARWGGASFEEDPDPQIRALGYVRLVREALPETAAFNLFPGGTALPQVVAQGLSGPGEQPPLGALSTLQYRPFENRGLDGRLLVRLESVTNGLAQLAPAQPGGLVPAAQLSDLLVDVVLEITVRACYDPALAAAVRASKHEEASAFAMAGALLSPALAVVVPGTPQQVAPGTSELRTVHWSLRAHRDRTLLAWTAAAQLAAAAVPADILGALSNAAPLGAASPFLPLEAVTNQSLTFAFDASPPPALTSPAALRDLAWNVKLDPALLGFTDVTGATAGLVGLGVAVIPTAAGNRAEGSSVADPEPLGLKWQIDPLLSPLLASPPTVLTALPSRLTMTTIAPAAPVGLADLFAASTPPTVQIKIPALTGLSGDPLLYDIILSLSFQVPLLETPTAIAATR
jgi:hypothetical protein